MRRIYSALRILVAALREIFDENAYARFLDREGLAESRESYRTFLREREPVIARRPRCC